MKNDPGLAEKPLRLCVMGNCQAQALEAWISVDAPSIQIDRLEPVWLIEERARTEIEIKFRSADLIFAQRLSDDYHLDFLRPTVLREKYGAKVYLWPNIYFDGYFPGIGYKYRLDGSKVLGPLDEYHFDFIIDSHKKGISAEDASRNFLDETIFSNHPDPISQSITQLVDRELSLDISISDWLYQNLSGPQLLFAMNHPTDQTLREVLQRLFAAANISERLAFHTPFKYTLDKIIIPIFGGIAQKYNLKSMLPVGNFKGVEMYEGGGQWLSSPTEHHYGALSLVGCYYRVYDKEADGRNN
jgi:hypothetical protein